MVVGADIGTGGSVLRWIWVDTKNQKTTRTTAHLFELEVFLGVKWALCGQVARSSSVRPCIRVPQEIDQCGDCRQISGIEKLGVRGEPSVPASTALAGGEQHNTGEGK